jgi:hypothetical protein
MGVLHVEWHFMAAIIVKKKFGKKADYFFSSSNESAIYQTQHVAVGVSY